MGGDGSRSHPPRAASAAIFFETAQAHWKEAVGRAGGVATRRFTLAGRNVRLAVAGEALAEIIWAPLAHLADDHVDASLTVLAWSGLDLAPLKLAAGVTPARGGLVQHLTDDATTVAVNLGADALTGLDRPTRLGLYWVASTESLPWWERAAPLRALLAWFAADAGHQLAHAGAVSFGDSAALVVGRAGSGKSTATLACLSDPELGVIGDDFVLIEEAPLRVSPVYGAAKLERDHLTRRLPWLAPHVLNPEAPAAEKRVVAWASAFPERLRERVSLTALVVPRVVPGAAVELVPTSGARVLLELAPTTLFQLPGTSAATFGRLGDWVRRLPAWELRLGDDLAPIPDVLRALLAGRGIAATATLRVSVVIPAFNAAAFLAEAVASLRAQTRPPDEIVIVDDGSTDETAAIASDLPGVRVLRQANTGVAAARNRGLAAATGTVIAWLDADDVWAPEALERQLATLRQCAAPALAVGRVREFRDATGSTAAELERTAAPPVPGAVPGAFIGHRSAYDRVGAFAEGLRVGEFVDWVMRAREAGLSVREHHSTVLYRRLHGDNLGRRERSARSDYLRVVKAALDRRRSRSERGE